MAYGILIVDDETTLAANIGRYLGRCGFEVRIAGDSVAGLELFDRFKPDLVLLDLRLPDADGIDVLQHMRTQDATIKVVMITAHGAVDTAVEAMKAGAYDYLTKPVALSDLKRLVQRAIDAEKLEQALSYYRQRDAGEGDAEVLIGTAPAMQAVKDRIAQLIKAERHLGDAPPPVLITGETGTGKDVIARRIHYGGIRRSKAFIEINCAALPTALVEEELFGHERGAFTDAKDRKLGLIEAADGGSLFLDEIGELDLGTQAKLLKILESQKVRRLGGVRERTVNVRLIAATNRNIEDLVRAGKFRSDLYFRLRIITIGVPPLSARGEDVLLLSRHFLELFAKRYGRGPLTLSNEATKLLLGHTWPGNVRELKNVIEQAVLFAKDSVIASRDLSLSGLVAAPPVSDNGSVQLPAGGLDMLEVERELLSQALERAGGNITQAARLLGLSRDALRYRLEKFALRQRS